MNPSIFGVVFWSGRGVNLHSHPEFSSAKSRLVAGVAELVDAPDLGSGAARRGGSSPFTRTNPS